MNFRIIGDDMRDLSAESCSSTVAYPFVDACLTWAAEAQSKCPRGSSVEIRCEMRERVYA